ncbi:MAG TPA: DMT family transporter, partial [Capillimicrobium sp.]|nr:DMT family transporter [Capillimicrobium sp.]
GARAGALDPLGVALGLAAALVYSAYILLSDRVAARVPPQLLATLVCTGAAGTLLAGSALLGTFEPGALTPAGWGWIGAIAFVSTVAAIALFFAGLRRVGPSAAAILSTVEPLVTIVLAAWVFGERLQPGQLVGGALILTGVVVLSAPPGTRRAVRRWALRAAAQRSAARRASASARAGRAAR